MGMGLSEELQTLSALVAGMLLVYKNTVKLGKGHRMRPN